jgi:hypothetical protein
VSNRWYVIVIPIPPVSQCRRKQTATADQEKKPG